MYKKPNIEYYDLINYCIIYLFATTTDIYNNMSISMTVRPQQSMSQRHRFASCMHRSTIHGYMVQWSQHSQVNDAPEHKL